MLCDICAFIAAGRRTRLAMKRIAGLSLRAGKYTRASAGGNLEAGLARILHLFSVEDMCLPSASVKLLTYFIFT